MGCLCDSSSETRKAVARHLLWIQITKLFMGGLFQCHVTAYTGIWEVFFLSLHFLQDTILVFHRHLSSSNYFLPSCPSRYQLLASLFSAATFHHVLQARGESKRRIMERRVPVRGRERERERDWTRDKSDRARASSFLLRPRGGVLVATVRVWESSSSAVPSLSERSAGWVASLMPQHFLTQQFALQWDKKNRRTCFKIQNRRSYYTKHYT